MKIKKVFRIFIGTNVLLVMTFVLLPALLINPDVVIFQTIIDFINKE